MKTCDLCDANEGTVQVCEPVFTDYGGLLEFGGPAWPVRAFEDNTQVRQAVGMPGEGRVLVVDGGGSLRCAMLGGNLAALAEKNGWAGVVINGCIRDSEEIAACRLGVKALGLHPQRSTKRGEGEADVPITVAGVRIEPGFWVYGDEDGLIVATKSLSVD